MKAVMVDIDGTISDVEHRRHHLLAKPKNWKAFNAAMYLDIPRSNVVELVKVLQRDGNRIVLCTGREEDYRSGTEDWLAKHYVPRLLAADPLFSAPKGSRAKREYLASDLFPGINDRTISRIVEEAEKIEWLQAGRRKT